LSWKSYGKTILILQEKGNTKTLKLQPTLHIIDLDMNGTLEKHGKKLPNCMIQQQRLLSLCIKGTTFSCLTATYSTYSFQVTTFFSVVYSNICKKQQQIFWVDGPNSFAQFGLAHIK
jgi:hypothetical protein